ncbi:hypothetical protein [Alicyclobacillus sp. ALC3]|uniref:hypothetical protein n=1 Tax=Alicyclobacillus sp. ALC3 TaxID=2796143 RepID=UPI0023791244|nr:hypothetical protein [Alicyclobacillus sp. ALC3]WDL95319.1 hypothetical protein JC200_12930 [Alicyclobacillus sp. ALC3]
MTVDIQAHVHPGLDDTPRACGAGGTLPRAFREAGTDVVCKPHYLHLQVGLDLVHELVVHGTEPGTEGCTRA